VEEAKPAEQQQSCRTYERRDRGYAGDGSDGAEGVGVEVVGVHLGLGAGRQLLSAVLAYRLALRGGHGGAVGSRKVDLLGR
jgi:hypothetical protein